MFFPTSNATPSSFLPSQGNFFTSIHNVQEFKPFVPSGGSQYLHSVPFTPFNCGASAAKESVSQKFDPQSTFQPTFKNELENCRQFKSQLCKQFDEYGYCQWGSKCTFAHGLEELYDARSVNNKYKSLNCRKFYKEKFCMFGEKCHFRHEFRKFPKIHKHYYMNHVMALTFTAQEILENSKTQPNGGDLDLNFYKELGLEQETQNNTPKCPKEALSSIGQSKRLQVFLNIANEDCITNEENFEETESSSDKEAYTKEEIFYRQKSPLQMHQLLNDSFGESF